MKKNDERRNILRRRRGRKVPLSLPDKLWQQYKNKLLKEDTENALTAQNETVIKNILTTKNETDLPKNAKSERENKLLTKDIKFNNTKPVDIVNSIKNAPNIFEQLSVKVDNSYAAQFSCVQSNEKLNKILENHDRIYEKVFNAKKSFNKFSIQALIYKREKELSELIIFAESELDIALNLLEKEKPLLLSLKKNFHDISVPLSIFTNYNTEQDNLSARLSVSINQKQKEIDILKQETDILKKQLHCNQQKLMKVKQTYNNIIKTKDRFLLETKRKLCLTKKRIKIINSDIGMNHHGVNNSLNIHAQLENLVALTKSLQKNVNKCSILENQSNGYSCNNKSTVIKNTDGIINKLNNQLKDLKLQNKQKDEKIRKLLISERRLNKQIIDLEVKSKLQEKQSKFKIATLTSSIENLKRQHDRYLIDRFHQKCLSIMLFEKVKQTEMQFIRTKNI